MTYPIRWALLALAMASVWLGGKRGRTVAHAVGNAAKNLSRNVSCDARE